MRLALVLPLVGLAACQPFDEGITVTDMTGKVVLPRAAATRTFTDEQGQPFEITDVKLIGPVYLGLYPAVVPDLYEYPSPLQGPVLVPGVPGDTYPYGGTTIGDIRNPCLQFLTCKVVSGRYLDFDEMIAWFDTTLRQPIIDSDGTVVTSGDYIASTCFDLLHYTSVDEVRVTAIDANEDGHIDAKDLDFHENGDGDFEAPFIIRQQEYFENDECTGEGCGFSLWGWMDTPAESNNQFTTCDANSGYYETTYDRRYNAGRPQNDLLNRPSKYIGGGDYVASQGYVYSSADDANVVLNLDYAVGSN